MKEKTDLYLNRYIRVLFIITIIALAFVYKVEGVFAEETLTYTLNSNAKLWVSDVDVEDILRVPTTDYTVISTTNSNQEYVYSWGPMAMKGYSNPTRWNTDLLYGAYINTASGCSNGCDIPVLFNITWKVDIDSRIYQADLTYQTIKSWILNNYNGVYIDFTDNTNQTWHTKLSTQVQTAVDTTENKVGGYHIKHFTFNVLYSHTLYNVDTINYIDINVPNIKQEYNDIEHSLGSTTYASVNLLTKTFAYAYMSYSGGSNGGSGTDNSQQEVIELQQQTNEKLEDIYAAMQDSTIENGLGNSFFSNFSTTDNGGISGILTAPLGAINNMLSGTCTPLTTTYHNKTISLPCGTQFWNDMGAIRTFLSMLESGILAYAIIRKMFLLIHDLKEPDNDKVEVMKL